METDRHIALARAEKDVSQRAASRPRQGLIVLGMHRSGTSALTRVLSLAGASLPRNIVPPDQGNLDDGNARAGFWESSRLMPIHDEALRSAGSSWRDPRPFPTAWFDSHEAATFVKRLVGALIDEYGTQELFVAKDPRISLLVPLWKAALGELGVAPLWLISMRNPAEVAASLALRDEIPPSTGHWLWMRYLLTAEAATLGDPRTFVSYEGLLSDWRSVLAGLPDRLGRGLSIPASVEPEIDRFLDRDLRHHAISSREFFARTDVPEVIKGAFAWFERAARSPARTEAGQRSLLLDRPPGWAEFLRETGPFNPTGGPPTAATLRLERAIRRRRYRHLRRAQHRAAGTGTA